MITRSRFRLADGTVVRCEAEAVELDPEHNPFRLKFTRISYYCDDVPVSLEGLRHLVNTIGIEGR